MGLLASEFPVQSSTAQRDFIDEASALYLPVLTVGHSRCVYAEFCENRAIPILNRHFAVDARARLKSSFRQSNAQRQ